jgi:hypothetical protein
VKGCQQKIKDFCGDEVRYKGADMAINQYKEAEACWKQAWQPVSLEKRIPMETSLFCENNCNVELYNFFFFFNH